MEPELQEYLSRLRLRVAAMTYKRKAWQLHSFFTWCAQHGKDSREVKQDDVGAFLSTRLCCRPVRQQMVQVIRDFYDFHTIVPNPAAGIILRRDNARPLPRVPCSAAVAAVINTLRSKDDLLSIRDLVAVELAYGSGLRRDELRKANIDDINFEEQTIRVIGKGNKARIVPLTEKTIQSIRRYLALRGGACRGPLLVSFMAKRLSLNGLYVILRSRVGIRPHLLRHACATHMLANGASIRIIQQLLGHESLKATQWYTAIDKKQLKEVIHTKHPRRT